MEISDVKKMIKTGEYPSYFIFHGPEHAVMKIYIQMIAKKGGYEISYVDSLMDLMISAKTKSLIKTKHLYVIMDDKEFMTNDKIWDKFNGFKDDLVVFYYTNTDKRLKFWKRFKDEAVEFAQLDSLVLTKYIQKEIDTISEKNCLRLIEACENDYGRILLELDKVKNYSNGDEDRILEKFLDDGTIYTPAKDAIFDFASAVLERDIPNVYDMLDNSKRVGEASLVMISVLYNNIKTLLQIQSAKDYKKLGLNGWIVKNTIPYKGNYSNGELVKAMKILQKCEKGIKTGEIPDDIAVDYFLVQIL